MDRGASSSKPPVSVGMAAMDLIGRIFGAGRRRRPRYKSGKSGSFEGYSRLQDRNCHANAGCVNLTRIENLEGRSDYVDEEDELRALQQARPSSSSDDEFSKRWTPTDHCCYRRRKGFYCMRLRIVSMARLVAMMRKVRLAYRRMMNAAAASKTILSLADLYNDIADLIPVPCGNNEARTIVVIRPIKCAPGPSRDDVEKLPGHGPSTRSSTTRDSYIASRPDADHDAMSTSGPAETVADHIPSSTWRRIAFRTFGCVCDPNVTSWTSVSSQDPS